ncbi:TetR/AcrR family transcriptional regulator [Streptomyces sp. NA04227]|uniref:TetR/AcrR family transcriptional regulator n=1 Tax=Streptomyces sp. NA04227 TaxID=2742136 RepID=UPI0015904536|nr:TetR/AcrR family transcriptional regulator [Streptomyces sp. NA04227]QKW05200.1 TetR/AcrR family transcriptional regulator [Streptomyces sp. NA04227]
MSTQERLVEATRELLWERGYVGTSPRAIQERAGAGQGSMYHHFSGKPELARAAITRTCEEMRETAERTLDGEGTAFERISAYLLREREVLRGCPVGRLTMDPDVLAADALREPVAATLAKVRARLAELVQEGVRRGELTTTAEPGEVAAAVLAVVQGGYVLARAEGSAEGFDAAVAGLRALLAPRTSA